MKEFTAFVTIRIKFEAEDHDMAQSVLYNMDYTFVDAREPEGDPASVMNTDIVDWKYKEDIP